MHDDATQPKRADVIPPDVDLESLAQQAPPPYFDDDDTNTGPGCWAWGIMGLFAIALSIGIVATASLAGFNQGLNTARVTAAVATNQNIARQCQILPTDIAAQRFEVIESRFEALSVEGQLPDCASIFVQQATIVFEQSQATATPQATMTATTAPTEIVEVTSESTIPAVPTNDSPYDLNGLLVEARASIASTEYDDAIETLDAIRAIDPDFEATIVTGLLFNVLTEQALREFRSPEGSLARGVLLTNRAEQFGDVQLLEVSFERSVAELYLDAQANLGLNYRLAILPLQEVIRLAPNYPLGTGNAATQLFEQYQAYGDALLLGGDACLAETQFQNALSLRPNNPQLETKLTTTSQQCSLGAPATVDPNATPEPINNATPTTGVAPVGQG